MRTREFRERVHANPKDPYWYARLRDTHCLQITRPEAGGKPIAWNDRDVNWYLRLRKRNGQGFLPRSITRHYRYGEEPHYLTRCIGRYRKSGRVLDDQWRDQIHEVAVRLRTYQIMLATLSQDAAKAGCEPLDSWTDTTYYDKLEREKIVRVTREKEPGA